MRAPRCARNRAFPTPRRGARASLAAGLAALVVSPAVVGGDSPGVVVLSSATAEPVSMLTAGVGDTGGGLVDEQPPAGSGGIEEAGAGAARLPTPRVIDAVTPRLARLEGLLVRLPTPAPLVVGFHEAATRSALELAPVGQLVDNRNATRVTAPSDSDSGSDYLILSSRGRVQPATSAVDIVMADDQPVFAPVTGTVSDVRDYLLYGDSPDHRVEIVPAAAPHLRVVLIHVTGVEVEVGDRVSAGHSVLARGPNRFPFVSQIDRETEPDRWPHVHLEVQPLDAPRPGDG